MKKLSLLILFVLVMVKTQAQDYFIAFSGTGDTTGIGGVKAYNLTTGESVILNGGDTLHLRASLGIESQNMNTGALKIYPNPMTTLATVTFVAPESGNAVISIVDLSGKTVCQARILISQGAQKINVSGISQGMYLVKITGETYTYSTKLVSKSDLPNEARIEYVSSDNNTAGTHLKSIKNTVVMKYNTGDLLLYKGNSGPYGTIVTGAPTGNMTVVFYFAGCMDKDGNDYTTVTLGSQTWMAENLKAARYHNGDYILNVPDSIEWGNLTTGASCDYRNIPGNSLTYGKLYNFYAVTDPRIICPTGWHIPSDAEWTTLTTYLGTDAAGGKLKETGTTHWLSPNTGATDESGFTALPGGFRYGDGTFYNLNLYACFWSSTEETSISAWSRILSNNYAYVTREADHKTHGYSVRCVKD